MLLRILILIIATLTAGQGSQAQTIPELFKMSHPDSLTNKDFSNLKPHLKDKRIVFAGEASHGGHESFVIKLALLKYLADEHGFRHFALEENVANCEKLNAFIAGKVTISADSAARQAYYSYPYGTKEFSYFISELRKYNQGKPPKKQIKFWGIDMQFAYESLKIIKDRLDKMGKGTDIIVPNLTRKEHFKYNTPTQTLIQIEEILNNLPSKNTEKNYLLQHLAVVKMKNIFNARSQKWLDNKNDTIYNSIKTYRDSCMALNLEWVLSKIGKKEKIMVWAHNAHIVKSFHTALRKNPLGAYIKAKHPTQTYYLGFDFDHGELLLKPGYSELRPIYIKPKEEQLLARLLDNINYSLLFIPFSPANQAYFSKPIKMRDGHILEEEHYPNLYDGIFFVKKMTATTLLK